MVKKISSQAFLLNQGFDRFCQSSNARFRRRKGAYVCGSRFFTQFAHFIPIVFGCNKRTSLTKQDRVHNARLVTESSIVQHLNSAVYYAVGLTETGTYSGKPTRNARVFSQGAAHVPKKKPEPRFPIAVVFGKINLGIYAIDDKMNDILPPPDMVIDDAWMSFDCLSQLSNRPAIYTELLRQLKSGVANRIRINCRKVGCPTCCTHNWHLSH